MLTNGDENVMPAGVEGEPLYEVTVNKPAGIKLLTKNKFCDKNILVNVGIPLYNGETEDIDVPDTNMATVTITNNSNYTIFIEDASGSSDSVMVTSIETITAEFEKSSVIRIFVEGFTAEDGYSVDVSDITGGLSRHNNDPYPAYLNVEGDGSFAVNIVVPTAMALVE